MNHRNHKAISIPISALALVAVFSIVGGQPNPIQREPKIDAEVKDRYVDPKGIEIKVLGIARIEPEEIECWDTNGKRSTELLDRVKQFCREQSTRRSFTYTYGKKTRYYVVSGNLPDSLFWYLSGQGFSYLDIVSSEQKNGIRLVRTICPPDTTTNSILVDYETKEPENVDLSNKSGAITNIGDLQVEIVETLPFKPGHLNNFAKIGDVYPGKRSTVVLKLKSRPARVPNFQVNSVLGLDHEPIVYVDLSGKPVSESTYLSDPGPDGVEDFYVRDQKPPTFKYAKARIQLAQRSDRFWSMVTNIDPRQIGSFRFSYTVHKRVQIGPLPLDPVN